MFFPLKMFDIIRNEVRHVHILHHLPTLFDRVQFRRVRRQLFKNKPIRMNRLEVFSCRKMRRQRIPNDHDLAAIILTNHRQKENHVFGVDCPFEDGAVMPNGKTVAKIQPATLRRHRDQAEPRLGLAGKMFPEHRRLATSAQLRMRVGDNEKPVSSMKISGMPRRFAFF